MFSQVISICIQNKVTKTDLFQENIDKSTNLPIALLRQGNAYYNRQPPYAASHPVNKQG